MKVEKIDKLGNFRGKTDQFKTPLSIKLVELKTLSQKKENR
jgi:hypothetical protein